jgi:integrase
LRARLGIRGDVRLHDLRALFVTEALAAGVDAGIVSRQAGHATAGFTRDIYQRVRREDARASAEAIDRALGAAFATPAVDTPLTRASVDVVKFKPRTR